MDGPSQLVPDDILDISPTTSVPQTCTSVLDVGASCLVAASSPPASTAAVLEHRAAAVESQDHARELAPRGRQSPARGPQGAARAGRGPPDRGCVSQHDARQHRSPDGHVRVQTHPSKATSASAGLRGAAGGARRDGAQPERADQGGVADQRRRLGGQRDLDSHAPVEQLQRLRPR
eukprot:1930744-Rhodomonas_salina.1